MVAFGSTIIYTFWCVCVCVGGGGICNFDVAHFNVQKVEIILSLPRLNVHTHTHTLFNYSTHFYFVSSVLIMLSTANSMEPNVTLLVSF